MSLGTSATTTEGRAHALRNRSKRVAIMVDRRYLERRESHFSSFTGTDKSWDTPFGYMIAGDVVVRVPLGDRGARLGSILNTEVRMTMDKTNLCTGTGVLQGTQI
jgi:hypothetical protein